MKRQQMEAALSGLSPRFIQEAAVRPRRAWPRAAAAALALLLGLAAWRLLLPGSAVTVYARDGAEITRAGVSLETGTIRDDGSQTGHPLMFYLQGPEIAQVRFSCERQQLRFTDWTETRDEYGNARNFTVPYGPDPEEYYYLLIDYVPDETLAALHDPSVGIADLPAALREDRIVLEITFADGTTDCRQLNVELRDDGALFASLTACIPTEADTFLARPDAEAIPRDILYGP